MQNYRHWRNAEQMHKIEFELKRGEDAKARCSTHIKIHPLTVSDPQKKGHSVHSHSVSEIAADARHDLSRAADNMAADTV